jgi:putative Holliday junction resolvase
LLIFAVFVVCVLLDLNANPFIMTFLAIDYGARRLGLALSDSDGRLALPLETQTRRPNDGRGDIAALVALIRARGVEAIVLGIPGGSAQSDETAQTARRFVDKLKTAAESAGLNLAFFETDERFSTSQAQNGLRSAGSQRANRVRAAEPTRLMPAPPPCSCKPFWIPETQEVLTIVRVAVSFTLRTNYLKRTFRDPRYST